MASSSRSGASRSRRLLQKVSQHQSSHNRIDSIEYCIRILNYLIGSLKLRDIPPIASLENITMEVLIQIHCKLMGIDFATDFIPSLNPKDDAERIILSLKDKYGPEKFDALDADRIVQKHPVHLRFLIENYHLIHDHQYKRSLGLSNVKSASGHHLGVAQPSNDELKGGDSFYVFPSTSLSPPQASAESATEEPASSQEEGEATSFLEPDLSDFETVDDFVINVYNSSTPNETLNGSDLEKSLFPETQPPNTAGPSDKIRTKRPLSSSPVDNRDWNQSSLITAPNESSIRGSPSKNVQQITQSKTKRPLSSSPVDNRDWNQSSLITAPNESSIRGSPSKKVQPQNKTKRPLSSSPLDNKKLNQSSLITAPNESSIKESPWKKVQQISKNKAKRPLSSSPVDNKKINQSSLITAPNESSIRGSPSKKVQPQNKTKRPLSSSPLDNKKLNQSSLITAPNESSIKESPWKKVQQISKNKAKRPLSSSPVDNKKINQSSLITAPNESSIRGSPSKKVQPQNKTKRPLSSSPLDNKKLNQSSLITAPNESSIKESPWKKVQQISKNKAKRPLSSSPVDNKKINQSSLITAPNESSIRGSPSKKVHQISQNKTKRPLSSSPVDNKKFNQSSLITAPNASSISGSPSKKVQRIIESRKSHSNTGISSNSTKSLSNQVSSTGGPSKRQLESSFNKQSAREKSKTAEDTHEHDNMKSINSKKPDKQSSKLYKGRTTNTLSLTDTGSSDESNEENKEFPPTELNSAEALHEVRDMHQNIRKQLTESWEAIDSEINKLKEKVSCPELKDECPPQPIPNLRWMMPVDLRFPYYPGGIIRSKCRQFKRAPVKKPPPSSKPSQVGFVYSNPSTTVEKGNETVFLDETDTE
ncbi:unnamed protein product [Orchesella dallaii]|uniref:Uncharacterized protein n=1 Tax=Orchesella dallaii TaxID=48710 RepID=A0ABP1R837_9HEXA